MDKKGFVASVGYGYVAMMAKAKAEYLGASASEDALFTGSAPNISAGIQTQKLPCFFYL
ncbi:MAG: hypothetical protein ACTTIC_05165 [Helicobacteraceae bacterium]